MGTQTDSNNGNRPSPSEQIKSKFKGRACSVPVLVVVFVQTFIVAALVLIIPLVIAIQTMTSANQLSTSTGRNVADTLALKIQAIEGSLVLENIGSLIQYVSDNTLAMYKTLNAYVDASNLEDILHTFAYSNEYQNYQLNMYFGTNDDGLLLLQGSGPGAVLIVQPANDFSTRHPNCKICQYFQQNFTTADWAWATKRNTSSAVGDWNLKTFSYSNFGFANFTFHSTQRPWYKAAAVQDPNNVQVQYTEPYLFAGGGAGETGGATAGITAVIPLFDQNKQRLLGVYGSDLAFTDMHTTLKSFVQTPNSFIYVMTHFGVMIGASNDESILDSTGNLKPAIKATDPNIALSANFLYNMLPVNNKDFTLLGGSNSTFKYNGIYFQITVLPQPPHFVFVNGAPETDYTGNIDTVLQQLNTNLQNSTTTIIWISIVVFIVLLLISSILTYLSVSVPLTKVTSIMTQATSFDFSAFKAMEAQKGNFITELGTMEKVFYTMIEKFASSIKANRELSNAQGQASQMNSQRPSTMNQSNKRV
ncbi:hypothetical protein BC830DRAFT_1174292 [Chytriomyces sp. MP71]|nr:hypothetical protein BC830DRAFT_1174292 [Chytriomyces sp. MP71]